jgi:hypothetical protein
MTFTLDNWQNRKYVTRDGRSARIVCVECKISKFEPSIVALIYFKENDIEIPFCLDRDGSYEEGRLHDLDLQDAPIEHTVRVHIYPENGGNRIPCICSSEKNHSITENAGLLFGDIVARVKVTYKEGQMDE